MNIKQKIIQARGIKLFIEQDGKEIARVFLYIMKNDLRDQPFGYMEDVFVDENQRGKGLATELVKKLIDLAKENNCYKIVCTSRHGKEKVHQLYEKIGFKNFGIEFKMYLAKTQ